MPLDTATKKTLEATEAAKKADKKDDKTKQLVKPGADFAAGAAALKPKPDKKNDAPEKKASPDVKAAKKEAVKKDPPKPEVAAKKVVEKKDDKLSRNAIHEATIASLNAAKFNEKDLKHWIATCSDMLKKADKAQVVELQGCIARFTQAEEALKKSKGIDDKVIAKFIADAAAKDLDSAAVQELIDEGEEMLPKASKTQVNHLKKALDKLYSQGGVG